MLPSDSDKSIHHWGIEAYTDLGAGGALSADGSAQGTAGAGPGAAREPPGPAGGAPRQLYFYYGMFCIQTFHSRRPGSGDPLCRGNLTGQLSQGYL